MLHAAHLSDVLLDFWLAYGRWYSLHHFGVHQVFSTLIRGKEKQIGGMLGCIQRFNLTRCKVDRYAGVARLHLKHGLSITFDLYIWNTLRYKSHVM